MIFLWIKKISTLSAWFSVHVETGHVGFKYYYFYFTNYLIIDFDLINGIFQDVTKFAVFTLLNYRTKSNKSQLNSILD